MTYAERNTAIAKLKAAGWTRICSITVGSIDSDKFGTLYMKDYESFYLNHKTINALPV